MRSNQLSYASIAGTNKIIPQFLKKSTLKWFSLALFAKNRYDGPKKGCEILKYENMEQMFEVIKNIEKFVNVVVE